MRKLALSDEILMKVDKPARYIGNEFNSVMKDTSQVNIRFAILFRQSSGIIHPLHAPSFHPHSASYRML